MWIDHEVLLSVSTIYDLSVTLNIAVQNYFPFLSDDSIMEPSNRTQKK